MTESEQARPAFQFSLLTLFCVMTLFAVMARYWPSGEWPVELHAVLLISMIGLVTMVVCGESAWRVMTIDRQSRPGRLRRRQRENFAFSMGIVGAIPLALNLWIAVWHSLLGDDGTVDIDIAMNISLLFLPFILFLLGISLRRFAGLRRNPALFAMGGVGLLANLVWPVLAWMAVPKWFPLTM